MAQDLLAASGQTEATLIEALREAPLSRAPGDEQIVGRGRPAP